MDSDWLTLRKYSFLEQIGKLNYYSAGMTKVMYKPSCLKPITCPVWPQCTIALTDWPQFLRWGYKYIKIIIAINGNNGFSDKWEKQTQVSLCICYSQCVKPVIWPNGWNFQSFGQMPLTASHLAKCLKFPVIWQNDWKWVPSVWQIAW